MKFQEWIPLIKIQNLSSLAGATLVSPPGLCSPIATGLPVGELHETWEDNTRGRIIPHRPLSLVVRLCSHVQQQPICPHHSTALSLVVGLPISTGGFGFPSFRAPQSMHRTFLCTSSAGCQVELLVAGYGGLSKPSSSDCSSVCFLCLLFFCLTGKKASSPCLQEAEA